jgi:hypothetical protein
MIYIGTYIGIIAWLLVFPILLGLEGQKKKIGFGPAFILSILVSPVVAWFLVSNSAENNPIGCKHCGNIYNEVEFCGICGKNEAGEILEKGAFVKK